MFAQIADKLVGSNRVSRPDVVGQNHLGVAVQGQPRPLIAPLGRRINRDLLAVASYHAPEFIKLDKLGVHVADHGIKHTLRVFGCRYHQRENRVLVQPGHAGDGANTHSLKHHGKRLDRLVSVCRMPGKQRSGSGIRERCGTSCTAITAGFVAVVAEFLNGSVLALTAGHGLFPFDLGGEKAQNEIAAKHPANPRDFGLAPQSVPAESGALIERLTSWRFDNQFEDQSSDANYDLSLTHSVGLLSESPCDAGLSDLAQKSFKPVRFLCHCSCNHATRYGNLRLYRSIPLIGGFPVRPSTDLHDFAARFKPIHNRMNRGHHVAVFRDVVSRFLEAIPDFCGNQITELGAENLSDGIGETHRVFFNEFFIQHSRKCRYSLPQACNFLLDLLLFAEAFSQFLLSTEKVLLRLIQNLFVVLSCHNWRYVTECLKQSQALNLDRSKNTTKRFWNQVVRDAERKLDRAQRKVKQLQESLDVFRKNAAERVPIPGELSSKESEATQH